MTPLMTLGDQAILTTAVTQAPDDAIVVEWGGGGSSLLIAQHLRPSQRLITIEHHPEWAAKIRAATAQYPNAECHHIPVVPGIHPYSSHYEECPVGATDYIHARGVHIPWDRVHVVLVDGIARGAVLASLRLKVRAGTTVFVHDYVGREHWYDWAVAMYPLHRAPQGSSPDPNGRTYPNSLMTLIVPDLTD